MDKKKKGDLVSNRKAFHNYEILDTFETGIVLQGTEVKSLREHEGSLQDAYVKVVRDELWLIGAYIAPWRFGNVYNHQELRERKLLMHQREIAKLKSLSQEKKFTIVPLAFYLKNGKIKVKIALGKGKSKIDKRFAIKERDEKRKIKQALKKTLPE